MDARKRRYVAIGLAVTLGLVALAVPVLTSLWLAQRQAREAAFEQLRLRAQELLRRSEQTRAAVEEATDALKGDTSCSPARIRRMQEITVRLPYIQAVGQMLGNRIPCSSLGIHEDGIVLPEAPARPSGIRSWFGVELKGVPGKTFNLYERGGIAVLVHAALVTDIIPPEDPTSLAVVAIQPTQIIRSRGTVKAEWTEKAAQGIGQFSDGGYLVVTERSKYPFVVALAAAPAAAVQAQVVGFAKVLLPLGLLCGAGLAGAVWLLTRQFLSMRTAIRAALRRNEFFLAYQPIIELRGGRCVGAEALIRWRRSDGTMVRPDLFIPVAEETGLIHAITARVMEMVARDSAVLLKARPQLHIGINLSSRDLEKPQTGHLIKEMIRKMGVKPHNVLVEATERGFMQADVARRIMDDIHALEVKIAIDDFGTGYSSLSYLEKFRLDYLKIDKSFVDTVGKNAATSQVVPHIIEMAKSLKLEMIAEGVETEAQVQFLQQRGVQYAQGYFYAKPMPFPEFAAYVSKSERLAT